MKDRIAEGTRPVPAYRERVPDHRPAAAGVHQATISAVERTERIPGIDVLMGVCRALAVTPDQLFRRPGLLLVAAFSTRPLGTTLRRGAA